jgi:LysR family glycine cleavage system transcriptional activator
MALRLPPMQALRAFEAAARMQSLTKAAAALNLTHGAIGHQIKALEETLGVRLTARVGRGIRLTDEGERFARRVRVALAEIGDAVREISERSNPRQLRVSVVPSFAARWLLPRIGRFIATHRDLDVDIRAGAAFVDFERDDVDIAIRQGLGVWPGVIAEHLLDDVFFPVCSPRFAQRNRLMRPQDLAGQTLLRSDGEYWKPWFEAAGLDWPEPERGPMYSDSSHVLQAAAEDQGVALTRSSLIGNDIRNGLLVQPFDVTVPAQRKYYLVYPPRFAQSEKLDVFRRWLVSEIAADPMMPPRSEAPGSPRGRKGDRRGRRR